MPQLRSRLIKQAARVRVSVRRVLVELAAFCPAAAALRQIARKLMALPQLALH
ncbi:MAG: hypothetical protein HC838_02485 [Spirulinaceae cyanobacterium RM2_2_10]|nr:hypothetical protein [Spirulinaceae cyanobacterium SM2_1_0]NJO19156.1 hypothetical protein [Spirulinaceae cyanobacterium RM2_2_10]